MLKLRSVGFIGKANNVSAAVDQTDLVILPVTELLNRADIETAAFPCTQLIAQRIAVRNNTDLAEIQKLLTLGKQFSSLFL